MYKLCSHLQQDEALYNTKKMEKYELILCVTKTKKI